MWRGQESGGGDQAGSAGARDRRRKREKRRVRANVEEAMGFKGAIRPIWMPRMARMG